MAETNAQKLDKILDELSMIRREMAARQHFDVEVADHEEFINGNGRPGLKARMALLEDNIRRTNVIGGIITTAIIIDLVARLLN